MRTRARASGAWLEGLKASLPIAGQELVDPAAMDPMRGRQLQLPFSAEPGRLAAVDPLLLEPVVDRRPAHAEVSSKAGEVHLVVLDALARLHGARLVNRL